MTEQELQVAMVRMRLFDAAHADVLTHLETLTQLSRGTLVHALQAALRRAPHESDPMAAAALTVFDLWLEWQDGGIGVDYENFAVFVRKRTEPA